MDKHAIRSALNTFSMSDKQSEFFSLLYHASDGLTREELALRIKGDSYTHPIAGILASISQKLVPGNDRHAYREYLDEIEDNGQIRLRLSDALRQAIDELPGFRAQLRAK